MKVLFLANVFPNVIEPTKGVFNQQLASAIAANMTLRLSPQSPGFRS